MDEQIPSLLVAASFGGEVDSESGSPNASKGVKDLRRKFEDNEADIITDLYARHFKPKIGDGSVTDEMNLTAFEDTKARIELPLNDSIGDQAYDAKDE